jgi:hypothetical protein
MKFGLVGAELLDEDDETDRQTDMAKLIDALRNYANAPTNEILRCLQK